MTIRKKVYIAYAQTQKSYISKFIRKNDEDLIIFFSRHLPESSPLIDEDTSNSLNINSNRKLTTVFNYAKKLHRLLSSYSCKGYTCIVSAQYGQLEDFILYSIFKCDSYHCIDEGFNLSHQICNRHILGRYMLFSKILLFSVFAFKKIPVPKQCEFHTIFPIRGNKTTTIKGLVLRRYNLRKKRTSNRVMILGSSHYLTNCSVVDYKKTLAKIKEYHSDDVVEYVPHRFETVEMLQFCKSIGWSINIVNKTYQEFLIESRSIPRCIVGFDSTTHIFEILHHFIHHPKLEVFNLKIKYPFKMQIKSSELYSSSTVGFTYVR